MYLKPDTSNRFTIEIPDEALAETRDWFPEEWQQPPATQSPKAEPGSLQERFNLILGSEVFKSNEKTDPNEPEPPC